MPPYMENDRLLEQVIRTADLATRPSRDPNYKAEAEALVELAKSVLGSSDQVLSTMAEQALRLTQADSAGINIRLHV